MTTGTFLLSPGGVFASANARVVHSNVTVTTSGSVVLTGFGNQELNLVINLTAVPTGVLPTIQFSLQAVDPGDGATAIGAPVTGAVLSGVGTEILTLSLTPTSAVQVSWTVTGTTPSFTGVYATMVSKITSPEVEGTGTSGVPAGGVLSVQGVPGGAPLSISGTVSAANPSVDANAAPAPGFSTQVGGSDGTNLQAARVHDLDTGGGSEFDLGVSLRLPGAGGSVAGGTASDPLRVDPTGATTQPISAAALPLPAGAATEATLATRVADATITTRLNTLGQKPMATSAPVVLASDQSRVPVAGSDGVTHQELRVHDLDTGGGTEFDLGVSLRLPGAGGSVAGGTSANPLRTDPTGTTTQPISAASLPLPTGAATEATLATRVADATITARLNTLGQKTMASSAPVVIASDQSRLPVETEVQADYNTGAGTQNLSLIGLAVPTAGGAVAGGTATNPIRTDPTGTTTQPVSAVALPLPTGAATEATLATRVSDATVTARLNTLGQKTMASSAPVVIASDQSAITVSSTQLPGALVGGRFDTNVGAWLGSTSPTVGQKLMAMSLPVVVASDQTAIPISGTVTATNPSVGSNAAAAPASSTQIGGTDGTNLRAARVYDLDTGVGNVFDLGVSIRLPASGGSVTGGTGTNPIRTDPTGTTTQPISVAALPLPAGAATELTLSTRVSDATIITRLGTLGQKLMAGSTPVVIASDQTTIPISGTVTATNASVGAINSGFPTSATQIGLSDGVNLRVPRVYDTDTGGGLEYAIGTILRASASGGSVETGVSAHPLRVDPTGTTTQPISAASLPLPTGASTDRTTAGGPFSVRLSDGVGFYEAPSETQLPSALVGGRLDTNNGAWLGSTAPTVGTKTTAASIPVTMASDQPAIAISGTVTATNPSVGTNAVAAPTSSTQIGGSDGTFLQAARSFDLHTGLATEWNLGVSLRLPTVTGSVAGGTSTDPLRVDPTGTTTQPVSVSSLPLPAGAATEATLATRLADATFTSRVNTLGQKTMAASMPVVIASDQSAVLMTGTVVANIGTTGGLALDATLTSGAQKAVVRGGVKGVTTAADVTSTAEGSNHQALDVQIYHGATAIDPSSITSWIGSTAPTVGQKAMAASLPVVLASDQASIDVDTAQLPAALVGGRLDINNGAWLGSTTPTVGQKTMASSLPVVIASDQPSLTIDTTQLPGALVGGRLDTNVGSWLGSVSPTVGQKSMTTSIPVVIAVDQSSVEVDTAQLPGALVGGRLDINNGAWLGSTAPSVGQKAMASSLPVVLASDQASIEVDTLQLPAALVSGRLDINNGAWLGSTAPTVGQKTSANSLPVVIASDQSAIAVTGTFDNNSVGPPNAAVPAEATQIGGSDGTNLQTVRVFDADLGAGSQYVMGTILRKAASGGSVEAGTATDPLRVDPTGSTTQPISAVALPLPTGAATEATLVTRLADATFTGRINTLGQKAMAASTPVVLASDQTAIPVTANQGTAAALAGYWPVRVTDGTNTLPTGDAVARAIFEKITDGTNTAAVKAASTAAVAADPALVVAVSPNNTVITQAAVTSGATLSNVAASGTTTTLLAANASRKMALFYNDSTATLYLKFGATASTTSYTVQLRSQAYFEMPAPVFTGIIDGIWSVANGACRVTELT